MELFGNIVDKIKLQKLLFLLSDEQDKPDYHFVPYKFGCYSFTASNDIAVMSKSGLLLETEKEIQKTIQKSYFDTLKTSDQKALTNLQTKYAHENKDSIIRYTYINYPFYAIKSEIAESILKKEPFYLERIKQSVPKNNGRVLCTIGYQGVSIEAYLVKLIKNDIKMLVDVRNNPVSMKFGFNKRQLERYCSNVGIKYIHIPELGINSHERNKLNSPADYEELFKKYCHQNLRDTLTYQYQVLEHLRQHQRIALTCFEADICQCHRKYLADAIMKLSNFEYELKHL
ncbi:MAG: DUF488 domain-containing protein [Bacteroidia bacterium]|nr:DUF488 domain-containing protein [Bacteroidia bacterium]MDW8346126.1 DUF488 domain-containing protein [Bacteroidia bacterium]